MTKPKQAETEVALPEVHNLSVNLASRAMADLQDQRTALNEFVSKQLVNNVDYGVVPGTPKASLFKPGAEKLAKLFQLGSRIITKDREIDRQSGFAMFSYTLEVFHLPTGHAIAQCEGSANSDEKKYKSRPAPDLLNTLQKMAQKRAYVGAIIIATGASDFFTQDLEDVDLKSTKGSEKAQKIQQETLAKEPGDDTPTCELCSTVMGRTKKNDAWYCPNFQDRRNGEHSYFKD